MRLREVVLEGVVVVASSREGSVLVVELMLLVELQLLVHMLLQLAVLQGVQAQAVLVDLQGLALCTRVLC
jgi:hypothetical protein